MFNLTKSLLVATAIAAPLFMNAQETPQPPLLTVRGTATITKPANEFQLNIGVVSQGETAEKALKENNTKVEKIIKSLSQAGLEKREYQTGRFNIRPIYSERPKTAASDWSPEIVRFEVSNSLSIKTDKIDHAGEIIDQTTKAGANSIDNIFFGLKNLQDHRSEAIEAATKNALQDARSLSSAGQVSLVRIKSISLDDALPPEPRHRFFAKSMGAESVPIEAGEAEISASVTVQFEIQ